MVNISKISYGGTAAIVTSMALIVGLDAATATKASIVSALLAVALADNLTDSLSIHIYQESERLEAHAAFTATLTNFATRFVVSLSFVLIVVLLPIAFAIGLSLIWGLVLLVALTYFLARTRGVSASLEVAKHVAVAIAVIAASRGIGLWIAAHFS